MGASIDSLALIQEFKIAVHCLQAISKALQGLLKRKVCSAIFTIYCLLQAHRSIRNAASGMKLIWCSIAPREFKAMSFLTKLECPSNPALRCVEGIMDTHCLLSNAPPLLLAPSMHLRAVQASLADAYSISLIADMTCVSALLLCHAACSHTDIRRPCATTCVPSR